MGSSITSAILTDDPEGRPCAGEFISAFTFPDGADFVDAFPIFRGDVDDQIIGPTVAARVGNPLGHGLRMGRGRPNRYRRAGFFTLTTFSASPHTFPKPPKKRGHRSLPADTSRSPDPAKTGESHAPARAPRPAHRDPRIQGLHPLQRWPPSP